jgi:hypothetical protein
MLKPAAHLVITRRGDTINWISYGRLADEELRPRKP